MVELSIHTSKLEALDKLLKENVKKTAKCAEHLKMKADDAAFLEMR